MISPLLIETNKQIAHMNRLRMQVDGILAVLFLSANESPGASFFDSLASHFLTDEHQLYTAAFRKPQQGEPVSAWSGSHFFDQMVMLSQDETLNAAHLQYLLHQINHQRCDFLILFACLADIHFSFLELGQELTLLAAPHLNLPALLNDHPVLMQSNAILCPGEPSGLSLLHHTLTKYQHTPPELITDGASWMDLSGPFYQWLKSNRERRYPADQYPSEDQEGFQ